MTEKEITLGACLIVGPNRLDELKRLLPQLAQLDQVVVVNTSPQGAITNYVKRLKKPFEIYEDLFRPTSIDENGKEYGLNDWGFARARNVSLKKLTTDYGFWIDTDDTLGLHYGGTDRQITAHAVKDGFLKIIKEAPDVDVWFADYHYSYDDSGNANVVHARERLFKNPGSWSVVYPIHECFIPDHAPKSSVIKDIKFLHLPAERPESAANRNMRMLLDWMKQLEKSGTSHDLSRCSLLIGETYWGLRDYRSAADWLENEYLAKYPTAISLERWQACSFAAKSYIQIGNLAGARRMALMSIDIEPGLPDGYFLLAECKWLAEEDPQDILQLIEFGGRADDPPPYVIKNPLDYTFMPFCLSSGAKYKQGQYEVALEYALKALKLKPNDPAAEELRRQAAEKLRIGDGTKAAIALYQLLKDFDEHEKAAQLLSFLPYPIQHSPEMYPISMGAKDRVAHLFSSKKFQEYFSDPPYWEPTPWEGFEKGYVPGRDRYAYLLSRIKRNPNYKKILVIGCDDGYHSILLAQQGYEVTGIDLNKEAIRIANERADKLGVSAKFVDGWFETLNPDELADLFDPTQNWQDHFDVVIASEVLEKAKNFELLLEGMGQCLKPNGALLITTPNGSWDAGDIPYNRKEGELPPTVRTFNQASLEALLSSNQDHFYVSECHFLPYSQGRHENQGWVVGEIVKGRRLLGPSIRIFCGEAVETFTPLNLMLGGIGGSETAVIHMADSWNRLGARVGVYRGDEPNSVGIFDGVYYRLAEEWNPELTSDVFISWRLPQAFSKGRPKADRTILWCHDIHFPIEVKPEWVEHIDTIAVLSEWHKQHIMQMHSFPEEKMWVTRNGIDPARYRQDVKKVKHSYFFSSSHERGLTEILALWPKIKTAIPDATLHVGYGTHTASVMLKLRRDQAGLDDLRATEQKMYETEGIVYHGRLNQWDLAGVQMECEAWLYPWQPGPEWGGMGGFPETYCITALEAMAAKAVPVSRSNAGLAETLKYHVEWTKEDTAKTIISKLKKLTVTPEEIEKNYKWAMSQTWQSLAREWLMKFVVTPQPIKKEVPVLVEAR